MEVEDDFLQILHPLQSVEDVGAGGVARVLVGIVGRRDDVGRLAIALHAQVALTTAQMRDSTLAPHQPLCKTAEKLALSRSPRMSLPTSTKCLLKTYLMRKPR